MFALSATAQTRQSDPASAIAKIVQEGMKTEHLRAVIIKVTQGDKVIIRQEIKATGGTWGETKPRCTPATWAEPEVLLANRT